MVQYVLVRRDLQADLGWPIGSVIAQGYVAAFCSPLRSPFCLYVRTRTARFSISICLRQAC